MLAQSWEKVVRYDLLPSPSLQNKLERTLYIQVGSSIPPSLQSHLECPILIFCSSYNVGLSELLSELLESVYKTKKDMVGVISSDDFLSQES